MFACVYPSRGHLQHNVSIIETSDIICHGNSLDEGHYRDFSNALLPLRLAGRDRGGG